MIHANEFIYKTEIGPQIENQNYGFQRGKEGG